MILRYILEGRNKGSSKIERAVLGSVAFGVVNNANCSVMVVR
jgi:nucleotide-binding universal stress UspA family protein